MWTRPLKKPERMKKSEGAMSNFKRNSFAFTISFSNKF